MTADDPTQLMVPVPDISVTVVSNSPSHVGTGGGEESSRREKRVKTKILLRGRSVDEVGSLSDRSVTPESPFMFTPPVTLSRPPPPAKEEEEIKNTLGFSSFGSDALGLNNIPPLTVCPFSYERMDLREVSSRERRRRSEQESMSPMSPLKEEPAEDSLYSSFEGSEISDQEREEGQRRRRRKEREGRRKGETVQPRLLTVGEGLKLEIAEVVGEGGSDGGEDALESVPARKISDCSNRSVDSGTKMSEVSKDEDECSSHRKLSNLSEASQNDFEEDERGRERERKSVSPVPSLPVRPLKRRNSVHSKIDFFNKWIQQHLQGPVGRRPARRRWLTRTQSELTFSSLPPLPVSPRRGSLLPDDTT